MKLLFASDSFKGTLTSRQTAALLEKAARQVWGEECSCGSVPVADGGEGTVEAVVAALKGQIVPVQVKGPLGDLVEASYGSLGEGKAVLEMASASGLPLIEASRRNPLKASSYGTGQLILAALKAGYRDLSIAIGGSATNDGGMGCMEALGVRFLDQEGRQLSGCGENLEKVASIDTGSMDPALAGAKFTVMCDVTNPLCGQTGATHVFGGQKGADEQMKARLEAGMCNYRDVLKKTFGVDPDTIPGSGAAGGLGAALSVFLKAEMKSGIETVLDLIGFDQMLEGVSLVVTGEGQTDGQSVYGKVLYGIGTHCRNKGVPAVALVGGLGMGGEKIMDYGIASITTTINGIMPLESALSRAQELYYAGAVRMFRMIQVGMEIERRK